MGIMYKREHVTMLSATRESIDIFQVLFRQKTFHMQRFIQNIDWLSLPYDALRTS